MKKRDFCILKMKPRWSHDYQMFKEHTRNPRKRRVARREVYSLLVSGLSYAKNLK